MNDLILKHGGYRRLKSFQIARLIYDVTIRFCNKFIPINSRTRDQMIQAARSGVQNIAEGSQASGTSKKTEIKLTNVARSSLEELYLDYEDFLRQHGLKKWDYNDPRRRNLVKRKVGNADQFVMWAKETFEIFHSPISEIAANGILVLIKVGCYLLDKQIESQAKKFQKDGGFTERLYQTRKNAKNV